MPLKTTSRVEKLRRKLEQQAVDAILISQPENRYYLSGFTGSSGFLLITSKDKVLATDFRYIEQVKIEASDYEILKIAGGPDKWIPELLSAHNITRLGFEAEDLTVSICHLFTDILCKVSPGLEFIPLEGIVESLRAIKEVSETDLIRRAIAITDSATEYIEDTIHAGMTEKELAWSIETYLRENGSESLPFEIIVASGPNAALPHARPSARAIGEGEPVIIDMGARYEGYSSDISRTFYIGPADETYIRVYDTVRRAQEEAIMYIKAGITGGEADQLSRKIIEQAGYGEAFGHSLGHGIGLACHELPRLGPGSNERLTDGMVFTIEPGIYLSGWGGVRIEDDVTIENGAVKVLSQAWRTI